MTLKYSKYNLKKLEQLLQELEYTIRYERGNFQSGYCLVENRKVAVINKFYDTEGRMNCLLEIIGTFSEADLPESLSPAGRKLFQQLQTPLTTDGSQENR